MSSSATTTKRISKKAIKPLPEENEPMISSEESVAKPKKRTTKKVAIKEPTTKEETATKEEKDTHNEKATDDEKMEKRVAKQSRAQGTQGLRFEDCGPCEKAIDNAMRALTSAGLDGSMHTSEDTVRVNTNTLEMKSILEKMIKMQEGQDAENRQANEEAEVLSHLGNYVEEPYKVIEAYFRDQHLERLVRHQIESYNHFINYQIQRTIQMFNPVVIRSENDYVAEYGQYFLEIDVMFENFKLYPPQIHENNGATKMMLPQEAKLRNFTYASTMTVDVHVKYTVRNTEKMDIPKTLHKVFPKINIGKMPIMLKSSVCVLTQNKHVHPTMTGECPMDCGGYFIVKGSEKTVLGQERAAENRVYCFDGKNTTKWNWFAEIKSVPDYKCISPKQIEMMIASKNNGFGHAIYMTIPRVKQPIELFVVFRALGILSDKAICDHILLDIDDAKQKDLLDALQASVIEANWCMTQEDAIKHITTYVSYMPINMDKETGLKKKREFALDVLTNDLFPHCRTANQKIYMIGYMAKKLLQTSMGLLPPDDRDSYLNKRIELTGTLLNNLFRNYFNKLVKEMQKQIVREINNGSWRSSEDYENIINMTNIYKMLKSNTIENGITRALSTGDFSIKQSNSSKVGVAQVLNRLTYLASLSHIRRINTPMEKSGELIAPRKLHNTTWGYFCPAETPEGQSIGVVKNISYMTHITIPTNSSSLYEYVAPYICDFDSVSPKEMHRKTKVFVNGCWLGITYRPIELYNEMKDKKYRGIINIYTSIVFDYKLLEIRICNDGGRLTRPVLRVRDNRALITKEIIKQLENRDIGWNDLLTNCRIPESVVEYIDPEEQNHSMIAMKCKDAYLQSKHVKLNYTHCEIHPSTIFGILASCIPFPEHNQSPRNTYQCLDINETVLLTSGRKIPIKDVKIGDDVVCFNPETMDISYTKVVNHYIRETDKTMYKVKTITGREIIATEDHKFMTMEGWKRVDAFVENDTYIGIMPNPEHIPSEVVVATLILDENMFRAKFVELGLELSYINKQILKLSKAGLLPLYTNHPRLPILARIFGFILADGSINVYEKCTGTKYIACGFDFGTETDVKMFENDVAQCGIDKCKYNKGTRTFNNVSHTTYAVTHNGSLPSLLIALGVTFGRKTETMRNPIPDWIMSGKKIIKREFIAGFQGGDGCKIRWNKMNKRGYNFICAETSQQINPKYVVSLTHFMSQCVELISEFGVDVQLNNSVMIDDKRHRLSYKILDKQINLINYVERIGYRYSSTKYTSSFVITEYLKYKNTCFEKHVEFIEKIRAMCVEGKTNTIIANEFNINVSTVSGIRRSYSEGRQISMPNLKNNTIENWLKDIKVINNMVFMPVVSVEQVENRLVSDITVESDDHSFIAGNNFLSSNCAMAKQAIGVYATNFDQRMDKTSYMLAYPTRPLVDTRLMNFIKLNKLPSGCQIHVAIMTHTGYNQEDSVLVNKGSIDRGLFAATIYHTEKDEDKNIVRDEIIRCKPDKTKTKCIKFGNYDKLDENGFIPENKLVENRDIIIAKIVPIKENRNDPTKTIKYEDQSKTFRTTEETYIDKNYTGRNGEGYNFAKVRVRTFRKPVFGDKFSSRSGQKGTCGNIIPECDMPFTKDGLRPDIILNPHAIPSRMTIAQLKETILGKVLIELGLFGDGTSFGDIDVHTICKQLQAIGYESYGNEIMYDGLTGEQMETSIFIGPVFYQRLKHMVNDKQHSRSIGPMVNLTRQPAEGRSRDGGFRIGEMERDVMLAHGMSKFCRERLYDASDKYSVHICKCCGMIACYNDGIQKSRLYSVADMTVHLCKTCGNTTDFAKVEVPYAYKLMAQELQTINVVPRILVE